MSLRPSIVCTIRLAHPLLARCAFLTVAFQPRVAESDKRGNAVDTVLNARLWQLRFLAPGKGDAVEQ